MKYRCGGCGLEKDDPKHFLVRCDTCNRLMFKLEDIPKPLDDDSSMATLRYKGHVR